MRSYACVCADGFESSSELAKCVRVGPQTKENSLFVGNTDASGSSLAKGFVFFMLFSITIMLVCIGWIIWKKQRRDELHRWTFGNMVYRSNGGRIGGESFSAVDSVMEPYDHLQLSFDDDQNHPFNDGVYRSTTTTSTAAASTTVQQQQQTSQVKSLSGAGAVVNLVRKIVGQSNDDAMPLTEHMYDETIDNSQKRLCLGEKFKRACAKICVPLTTYVAANNGLFVFNLRNIRMFYTSCITNAVWKRDRLNLYGKTTVNNVEYQKMSADVVSHNLGKIVRPYRLVDRCTGMYVQIFLDIIQARGRKYTPLSDLEFESVDFGSQLKIKSRKFQKYICVSKDRKSIVASNDIDEKNCMFVEKISENYSTEFESFISPGHYLTFTNDGRKAFLSAKDSQQDRKCAQFIKLSTINFAHQFRAQQIWKPIALTGY
uniref:Uncharacterized protein n=1 Tax=Romanomermis culicivorax TaxID=13658 RepID=A0A915JZS8_ROMCU